MPHSPAPLPPDAPGALVPESPARPPRAVAVGLVQMRCAGDAAVNLARALDFTRAAAARGAAVVVLPELFLGPYFCQTEDHATFARAEAVPGPTTAAFEAIAAELGLTVLVSLFEKRAQGLYHNTLAVVRPDGYAGKYRKMHIPDDPLFYEKFYFTPGDLGYRVFDTAGATSNDAAMRVGTLVCWDQWYPEAARLTAMQGADVLAYPTAIGWMDDEREADGAAQHDAWETVQRSHAVANGCYVVSVNRIGFEATPGAPSADDAGPYVPGRVRAGIEFWGGSFVAAPDGRVLARASHDAEEVLVVDLDLDRLDAHRTVWPFFRDRRVDSYGAIKRRWID